MKSSMLCPPTIKAKHCNMSNDAQSVEPPWTILRTIQWTTGYFADRGLENPRTDAEILLADSLQCQRIDLYLRHDQPLHEDELSNFKVSVQRRAQREPVAYILGTKEFWSLDFRMTPDVLIPRPETEGLVETALQLLPENAPVRVLELGTGSGIITIALAHERPNWRFWASDFSEKAIEIARSNARDHQLEERVLWRTANWFDGLHETEKGMDLIISNPPYIATPDLKKLEPDVRNYEPMHALDGGQEGLDSIGHIIRTATTYLRPDGWLLLEIGYDQGSAVLGLARQSGTFYQMAVDKDFAGLDRIARLRKRPAEE